VETMEDDKNEKENENENEMESGNESENENENKSESESESESQSENDKFDDDENESDFERDAILCEIFQFFLDNIEKINFKDVFESLNRLRDAGSNREDVEEIKRKFALLERNYYDPKKIAFALESLANDENEKEIAKSITSFVERYRESKTKKTERMTQSAMNARERNPISSFGRLSLNCQRLRSRPTCSIKFVTLEERLKIIREKLSDWFNDLYSSDDREDVTEFFKKCKGGKLNGDDLLSRLSDGFLLIHHLETFENRKIYKMPIASPFGSANDVSRSFKVHVRREKIDCFIRFCKERYRIRESLCFEPSDLSERSAKKENAILHFLLEVAKFTGGEKVRNEIINAFLVKIDDGSKKTTVENFAKTLLVSSPSSQKTQRLVKFDRQPRRQQALQEQNRPHTVESLNEMLLTSQCVCEKKMKIVQKLNKHQFEIISPVGKKIQISVSKTGRLLVRVGGGYSSISEFIEKNDPCRRRMIRSPGIAKPGKEKKLKTNSAKMNEVYFELE